MTEELTKFLDTGDTRELDDALSRYLTTKIRRIKKLPPEKMQDRLIELVGELSVVLPLHLSRKHVDLLAGSGLVSILRAYSEVSVDGTAIEEIIRSRFRVARRDQRKPIVWTLPDPITLGGYDPRFRNAQATYADLIKGIKSGPEIETPHLKSRYYAAKADIYRDFHDQGRRYDLLIVDFAWLPELAYQGHLIPLERFEPDVEGQIRSTLRAYFRDCRTSAADRQALNSWTDISSELCKAGNELHYGLPLFVNTHGVLAPKASDQGVGGVKELEKLMLGNLEYPTVQTLHSAGCVYQLYAHYAYEGAVPIRVERASSDGFKVQGVDFTSRPALNALALYLARIEQADDEIRLPGPEIFEFGHEEEERFLATDPTKGDRWAPVFSSELYGRLRDTYRLGRPFERRDGGKLRMLSSFGGYALAVSKRSVNPWATFVVATKLLEAIREKESESWAMIPPGDLKSAFVEATRDFDDFSSVSVRPRIPFWSHLEELISVAVEEVYDKFKVSGPPKNTELFGDRKAEIVHWLEQRGNTEPLKKLKKRIRLSLRNNGWPLAED